MKRKELALSRIGEVHSGRKIVDVKRVTNKYNIIDSKTNTIIEQQCEAWYYVVECEKGHMREVAYSRLKEQSCRKCNDLKKQKARADKILAKKHFNTWTVVGTEAVRHEFPSAYAWKWLCRCVCGKEQYLLQEYLGKSNGCLECANKNNSIPAAIKYRNQDVSDNSSSMSSDQF